MTGRVSAAKVAVGDRVYVRRSSLRGDGSLTPARPSEVRANSHTLSVVTVTGTQRHHEARALARGLRFTVITVETDRGPLTDLPTQTMLALAPQADS